MRKRIRIQIQKKARRRDEPQEDVKIPKVRPEIKKKLTSAKEREKEIDALAKEEIELEKKMREFLLEIDEVMKQKTPAEWRLKYVPIARDCLGNPFDLRRQY
jgi:seryl-tRNA synthetase